MVFRDKLDVHRDHHLINGKLILNEKIKFCKKMDNRPILVRNNNRDNNSMDQDYRKRSSDITKRTILC